MYGNDFGAPEERQNQPANADRSGSPAVDLDAQFQAIIDDGGRIDSSDHVPDLRRLGYGYYAERSHGSDR